MWPSFFFRFYTLWAMSSEKRVTSFVDLSFNTRVLATLAGYTLHCGCVVPLDRIKTLIQGRAGRNSGVSISSVVRECIEKEGVSGLYRGGGVQLLMFPGVLLYYQSYSFFKHKFERYEAWSAFNAAVCARTLETTIRMPLEILKTQKQVLEPTSGRDVEAKRFFREGLERNLLFKGYSFTLFRDLSYSAIYWVGYEKFREKALSQFDNRGLFATCSISFVSAWFVSSLAAAISTPLDVLKTYSQAAASDCVHLLKNCNTFSCEKVACRPPKIWDLIRRREINLFAGFVPRMIRIPLGMSSMMLGIEMVTMDEIKRFFGLFFFIHQFQEHDNNDKLDLESRLELHREKGSTSLARANVYGSIAEYQYYFVELLVGEIAQRQSVILDTGSGFTSFPCKDACDTGFLRCGWTHLDKRYSSHLSRTSEFINCSSRACTERCVNEKCFYVRRYGELSMTEGFVVSDYIQFGELKNYNKPVKANFGCANQETNLFYTQKANGIMGISGRNSLLHQLSPTKNLVYSLCLADVGGELTLGGDNEKLSREPEKQVSFKVMSEQSLYSAVSRVEVVRNDSSIFTFNHRDSYLLDTGTTFTKLPFELYEFFRDHVFPECKPSCGNLTAEKSQFANIYCFKAKNGFSDLHVLPSFRFYFEDAQYSSKTDGRVEIFPESYMWLTTSESNNLEGVDRKFCSSFYSSRRPVLGSTFFIHKQMRFDANKLQVTLTPARCPRHTKVPYMRPFTNEELHLTKNKTEDLSFLSYDDDGNMIVVSLIVICLVASLFFCVVAQCRILCRSMSRNRRRYSKLDQEI